MMLFLRLLGLVNSNIFVFDNILRNKQFKFKSSFIYFFFNKIYFNCGHFGDFFLLLLLRNGKVFVANKKIFLIISYN